MDTPVKTYPYNKQAILSLSTPEQQQLTDELEDGNVIYLPQLAFVLDDNEMEFLTPDIIKPDAKNISFNRLQNKIGGCQLPPQQLARLRNFMRRYSEFAQQLVQQLFPDYQGDLQVGRTSYRPVEVKDRPNSYRKDDTRLHVDAFPSMPVQGRRILRVFSNINPFQQARVWNLGEPFSQVAARFLPTISKPKTMQANLLKLCKITKGLRTPYDHYMLHLHDNMKADETYQQQVDKVEMQFPPGTTWCVFTDQASHAALTGQYLLEQTFYLPVTSMMHLNQTPLKVLEQKLGCALI